MVTPRQAAQDRTTSDRGNNGKEATRTIALSHHGNELPYLIIAIIEKGHAINTPVIRSNRISNLFWSVSMPTPRSGFPAIPPHPLVAVARRRSQKTPGLRPVPPLRYASARRLSLVVVPKIVISMEVAP